jgi:hypothetical protein
MWSRRGAAGSRTKVLLDVHPAMALTAAKLIPTERNRRENRDKSVLLLEAGLIDRQL